MCLSSEDFNYQWQERSLSTPWLMCEVTGLEAQDTAGGDQASARLATAPKAVSSLWPFNIPLGRFSAFHNLQCIR